MPLIHNEHVYATPSSYTLPFIVTLLIVTVENTREHAYTQDSVDLMAATLPLPQIQPTQISGQDVALIILMAMFILLSGAAAIRLAHIVYYKKDASPRVVSSFKSFTESSSTLPLTSASTPRLSSSIKFFGPDDMNDSNEKIEQDITFSFPFARVETPPCPPRRPPAFLREEEEDIAAMLSIRAGQESVCRRGHREKKESESSLITTSTVQDSLCPSEPRSSVTSVYSLSIQSEDEEEEDIEDVEVYEVKRAQTQSIEVKRGVLMSWRTSRPPNLAPDMPTVVISESSSDTGALNNVSHGDNGFLQPLPSLLVTQPSDTSLVSTTSSVSVDLDEFPLPPALPPLSKNYTKDLPLMDVPRMSREEKRSTVDQVITMYERH
ncbi:hypothetical protein J3R30DRAFT_1683040 [Lentinula aciculospora]|uniref:Uncharacterized protein n=1 Tax=Lentinula aciculospora TaxID=153920 RepID=A0A9W8ZXS6_9AGAR|nr:hypothetical protein J3R30DRAFT_1683040 [Lentinula aciculospora]